MPSAAKGARDLQSGVEAERHPHLAVRLMCRRIDHFLTLIVRLFSSHERSDTCGGQEWLSHLKKRAKISVSNFYPGDEQVTPTVELASSAQVLRYANLSVARLR